MASFWGHKEPIDIDISFSATDLVYISAAIRDALTHNEPSKNNTNQINAPSLHCLPGSKVRGSFSSEHDTTIKASEVQTCTQRGALHASKTGAIVVKRVVGCN